MKYETIDEKKVLEGIENKEKKLFKDKIKLKNFYDRIIYETENFVVAVPKMPHIPRVDGGHLWIRSKEEYFCNRGNLSPKLAVEVMRLTMLIGEAMRKGMENREIHIQQINYQENGNWAYLEGKRPTFHIHLYGRVENSSTQTFGEALVLPNKSTHFYDNFESFNDDDIKEIKNKSTY